MIEQRKVKGSVLLDMVKVVRAVKDAPWDDYLTDGDREIVNSMVIPTAWYPIESYQRIGLAVFDLVAKGDESTLEQFGKSAMKDLFHGSYRPFLDKGNPLEALGKFLDLRKSLFNFSRMEITATGENSARVTISEFGDFERGLDLFEILLDVHLRQLIELNGGKNVTSDKKRRGEGDDLVMEIDLAWE